MGLLCLSASLLFLSCTASQPAHTLQTAVHWPQGSGSHHKGVVYVRVCVFVPEPLRGQVCFYVCVLVEAGPWELRVGAS